jgi:hypothetical protein
LHQGLNRAEVVNKLITIPNGLHGGFPAEEMERIYDAIFSFLGTNIE